MTKNDIRILKTRKTIKNTFKKMIIDMPANSITIKELAERAMINRKTFYLHYSCIEELYEDILLDISNDYFVAVNKISPDSPFTKFNKIFFEFMASQEAYVEKLICDYSYQEFANKIFITMLSYNRTRYNPYKQFSIEEQNIINTFLAMGSINMYRRWIKDNKKIPIEDLIDLSGKLFYNGISAVIVNKKKM